MIIPINQEIKFEEKLAALLTRHGWEPQILMNPTEDDLMKNWASIIFNNNRDINRLGEYPLTDSEMSQIVAKFDNAKTPYERNKLINGEYIDIVRDNADDVVNCGKTVYLKLFDAREINTGQSVYQIARQPKFKTSHPLAGNRRGDVMLLINGMPLIHIELKRSGVDVSQAVNQIKKYTHEGVFAGGIYSLVQIFVAMTPEKTLYFSNPGAAANFSPAFYFHWADFNNNEIKDWQPIAANFLSIPMAHQLIGTYTIADDKDKTLKVLRSYQYYATNAITERVHATNWDDHAHRGGFVWHTTGSGKTMTSFKAAQLIARANDADKVVFLLDRIELSTQSADEYRGFTNADDNVLDTEDTRSLISLLESNDKDKNLIVTSLQKMSRITHKNGVPQSTIDIINKKRVVFIVDECHRGVYGSMLMDIKNTFPRALLFGFTGTPVFDENSHGELTTEVIFGDMLHKYTLANGIPDENVLGFDLYREDTFDERDIRREVALKACEAKTVEEIEGDKEKMEIFNRIMNETDMLKIEDEAKSLYVSEEHRLAVVHKIMEDFPVVSRNGKFHSILATKNIPAAIAYYQLFKQHYPDFKVAAIFEDSIDNDGKSEYKEDAILEMLGDYNERFGTSFQQSSYARYKKDVAKRLAHKAPYQKIEKDKQLNLLIVVTQMLTGYDSKWVNTLYVDKLLKYVDVIQAFSRTNRLFGPEKPFGIIKYFCRPNRMKINIDEALELYVDQPMTVFTDKLEANLEKINTAYRVIKNVFVAEGIPNFDRLPQAEVSRKKFAKEFCEMTKLLEASKMQGFTWEKRVYEFEHTDRWISLTMEIDEETYAILLQRYRELFESTIGNPKDNDVYQLESYITETGAGTIDANYINDKFIRYVKYLYTEGRDGEMAKRTLEDLHYAFASLSQRDQRTALTIIHDIQTGDLTLVPDKTINDYISDYQKRETDYQIRTLCDITGLDVRRLKDIVGSDVNDQNYNESGRFDDLMRTFDRNKASDFLKRITGKEVKKMFVISNASSLIRRFILFPTERGPMLKAYFHDDIIYDENRDNQGSDNAPDTEDTTVQVAPADNILSDDEKRENIANRVMKHLRGVKITHPDGWPGTQNAVNAMFKIMYMASLNNLDGVAIDLHKCFNELFARKTVDPIDKHVDLGTLTIKLEVYLKKLYFLLEGKELPLNTYGKSTLANAIHELKELWNLKLCPDKRSQNLSKFLDEIRQWRNTGSGAHFSTYDDDSQLDEKIEKVVTIYVFVTGAYLARLAEKYPVLSEFLRKN